MRWFEVTVHTAQAAVELVANEFHELGAGGVAIEDPEVLSREWDTTFGELYQLSKDDYPAEGVLVKGYIPETIDIPALCDQMSMFLSDLRGYGVDAGTGVVTSHEVFEEDWAHAWKKYYKPVRVSKRLLVKPTWESLDEADADADGALQVIEMDPGMAFGTGTHPTTLLCMQALEKYIEIGGAKRVIDVGTGTAILAIAAVKLGADEVLAIDLDPVAVESAQVNVELNGVAERVEVRQGDLLTSLNHAGAGAANGTSDWRGQADLVVANILADVIVLFVDDVMTALRPGGLYVTSGIIAAKAEMVQAALERAGFEMVEQVTDSDWVALVARK
jgi:ribosomal protein L11 methyltransferase